MSMARVQRNHNGYILLLQMPHENEVRFQPLLCGATGMPVVFNETEVIGWSRYNRGRLAAAVAACQLEETPSV